MLSNIPDVAHNPRYAPNSSTRPGQTRTVESGMDAAIAEFLDALHDRNRSAMTIARYGEVLRCFAMFARAELHQDRVRVEDVDKALVVAFVREGGRPDPSPATRNARLSAVRSFVKWLVAEGRLARDPIEGVARARLPKRSPTFLTPDEYAKLRATVERVATEHYLRRDLAIIVTLWNTGLRLRELLSLNLDQVDIANERFRAVRRKGGDIVDVHGNVETTIAVRRWLWERRRYPHADKEQALFLSDRGRRLSPRAVEDLVGKYARAAKLGKHVAPHALRHSCATALISLGTPIEVVAEVLNHRSLDTTRLYVHLAGQQVHAAVAALAGERPKRTVRR